MDRKTWGRGIQCADPADYEISCKENRKKTTDSDDTAVKVSKVVGEWEKCELSDLLNTIIYDSGETTTEMSKSAFTIIPKQARNT